VRHSRGPTRPRSAAGSDHRHLDKRRDLNDRARVTLDRRLEDAEARLDRHDYAAAYNQLRAAYPMALRQLATTDPAALAVARRALLRCQDGLARCHEVAGELGAARHAAHAALQLATVLHEPELALGWRATYLDTLIDRLEPSAVIELREGPDVDLDALVALRARCAFSAQSSEVLGRQLAGTRWIVHAHVGDRLVGFARAISDGVATAYLSSVMVDPDYRRRGIGRALLARLMDDRDGIKFVLHTRSESAAFYAALGFVDATAMMVRDRS